MIGLRATQIEWDQRLFRPRMKARTEPQYRRSKPSLIFCPDKLSGKNSLDEMCMATPAALRGSVLSRTMTKLHRIGAAE
jgi:hypothetical protein